MTALFLFRYNSKIDKYEGKVYHAKGKGTILASVFPAHANWSVALITGKKKIKNFLKEYEGADFKDCTPQLSK